MDKNIEYKRECLDTSWIAPDCSKRLDRSQCGIRITLPPREEEQEIEEEREESQQVWKILDKLTRKSIWAHKEFLVKVILESKYISKLSSNPIFWVSGCHGICKYQRSALPKA